MKKLTKKNNKGFSLVELIVVVLIMAIIAVALAPQVTKWVDNSRQAKDMQSVDALVSACQLAVTKNGNAKADATYSISNGKLTVWNGTDTGFNKDVAGYLGENSIEFTSKVFKDHTAAIVTVSKGVVTKNVPDIDADLQ